MLQILPNEGSTPRSCRASRLCRRPGRRPHRHRTARAPRADLSLLGDVRLLGRARRPPVSCPGGPTCRLEPTDRRDRRRPSTDDRSRPRGSEERALRAPRSRHAGGDADRPRRPTTGSADRAAAFASMDGLLLSGGADVDPARYGRATQRLGRRRSLSAMRSSTQAWIAATERGVPVLGICRGIQAINVFSGGTLLQHVEGHGGPGWGTGPPRPTRSAWPRAPGSPGSCSRPTPAAASCRQLVPPPGRPGGGPGAGSRRQRVGEQPGGRPRRGSRGRRRPVPDRRPVPPGADGVDAAGVRAPVRGLRRCGARAGVPPLIRRSGNPDARPSAAGEIDRGTAASRGARSRRRSRRSSPRRAGVRRTRSRASPSGRRRARAATIACRCRRRAGPWHRSCPRRRRWR